MFFVHYFLVFKYSKNGSQKKKNNTRARTALSATVQRVILFKITKMIWFPVLKRNNNSGFSPFQIKDEPTRGKRSKWIVTVIAAIECSNLILWNRLWPQCDKMSWVSLQSWFKKNMFLIDTKYSNQISLFDSFSFFCFFLR